MKSKQLANVLIKVLGLYFCLGDIPRLVSGLMANMGGYEVGNALQMALGIYLIAKSRPLAEFWFKDEAE